MVVKKAMMAGGSGLTTQEGLLCEVRFAMEGPAFFFNLRVMIGSIKTNRCRSGEGLN